MQAQPNPRHRAVRACDHCRKRKLRCSGDVPACSNCALHNSSCSFLMERSKPGPKAGSKRKKTHIMSADDVQSYATEGTGKRLSVSPQGQASQSPMAYTDTSSGPSSPYLNTASGIPGFDGTSTVQSPWTPHAPAATDLSTPDSMYGTFRAVSGSQTIHREERYTRPFAESRMDPSLPNSAQTSARNPVGSPPAGHQSPPQSASPSFSLGVSTHFIAPAYVQPSPTGSTALAPTSTAPLLPQTTAMSTPGDIVATFRYAHALCPLYSSSELARVVEGCSATRATNVGSRFFLHSLECLRLATISSRNSAAPLHFATRKDAMTAYFACLSQTRDLSGDDITCVAAGLIYLSLAHVFTTGWTNDASLWLRLALDVATTMPDVTERHRAQRCWFARAIWLWDKALSGYGTPSVFTSALPLGVPLTYPSPSSPLYEQLRSEVFLTPLQTDPEFDEDQRTFAGLTTLCMDLEQLVQDAETRQLEALQRDVDLTGGAFFSSMSEYLTQPLCERVRTWVKSSSVVQESLLQLEGDTSAVDDNKQDYTREVVGRVLQFIYFGMALKFDYADRVRCGMRKTSLYVAVTRIVDAADWVVSSRHMWLWNAFAEPALLLARDFMLEYCDMQTSVCPVGLPTTLTLAQDLPSAEATCAPSNGDGRLQECALLSLIRDVFADASASLDPTSTQWIIAQHTSELLSQSLNATAAST